MPSLIENAIHVSSKISDAGSILFILGFVLKKNIIFSRKRALNETFSAV